MTVDFKMIQGNTRYLRFPCVNADKTPIDLSTAQTIEWGCSYIGDTNGNTLITKDTLDGISIEDTNVAVVKIDPEDTKGGAVDLLGKFQYTFEVKDFAGDVFSLNGFFIIDNSSL